MTPIPAFFFRRAVPDDAAVLAEGDGYFLSRRHGVVAIECSVAWRPEFGEAYRRHDAEAVRIDSTIGRDGRSLDFLRDLPGLRRVELGIDVPIDVAPLADLAGLESLRLNWRAAGAPDPIDFRRLDRLEDCSISWHPSLASALEVASLRLLTLHDAPRLKELNLTGLPRLVEIDLISCAALTRVHLHERAEVAAIELAGCGKLRPDWRRLAPDLRYLCLRGRIGFAVEEVARAERLRFLWAELPSKQSSWDFLRDLPDLEGVRLIDLKMTKDVEESVREINRAKAQGPTLSARPSRYLF